MADGDRVGGVYLEIGSEVAKGTPEDSIKRIRAAVKRAAAIKMPVALDKLKRTELTAARKLAQETADSLPEIRLPVGLKKLTRSAATAGRKAAQEVIDGGRAVQLPVELGRVSRSAVAGSRRAAQALANAGEAVKLPVRPDEAAGFRARVDRIIDDIEDREAELPVIPDVDSAWASTRLSMLTRPRTVDIIPELNKAATAKVMAGLLALSGARAVTDRIQGLGRALGNLDRSLPAIAGMSTAILNVGSAALAGTSSLLTIGGGLASIAPAALALPGIFAGFGAGLGVMIAALKDAGDVLSDLGPKFSALQDTISENFWAQAEEPIRNLVSTWMPTLKSRLGEVADQLGIFFGSFSNALSSADNVGHLDSILASVRDSIDIAGEGIAHFVDALMGLADVGASYLPELASWFNRISETFSAWVEEATESGEIFEWIDTGIAALQDLGRVVWGIGGVFSNLGRAAAAAGGGGLGGLADGLENINRALEGPAFQGAMTTVFQGAYDAMQALGPGLAALGDAFVDFAPTLAEIMGLAGEIGSVGLGAIASAFENPAFQGGLTDFFEGVLEGVEAVAPHIPALAEAFGSVASFAGTLASVLGPVLGAAIEALAPVVTDLMDGLGPVVEVLGGALVSAIETVAPFIQDIVGRISEWVQNNPELAATIGAAAGAIGLLIGGAVGLISALAPVLGSIISVVTAVAGAGGLSAVLATVSAGFSAFMAAAAPIIGIVALVAAGAVALAGALVYAWQSSEDFRNAVMGLFTALQEAAQPVIEFITGTVIPVVMQVVDSLVNGVQMILDALIPFWTVMLEIWTEIINIMTPVVEFILSVLAPIFQHLGTIVSAAFTFISTVISEAINIVTAILQVFLEVLRGNWSGAWAAIQNVVAVVWQAIQNVVGAAITFVWTIIQSMLSTIQAVWNAIWSTVRDFVVSVWNAIVNKIMEVVGRVVSAVVSFVGNVKSNIQSGFNTAKETAINAFQALKDGVIEKAEAVVNWVKDLPGKIKSALGNLGDLLLGAGRDIMNGLKEGINDAWEGVKNRLSDITDMIPDWKGPRERDQVLLLEAGHLVMEGFDKGLQDSIPSIRRTLGGLTDDLPGMIGTQSLAAMSRASSRAAEAIMPPSVASIPRLPSGAVGDGQRIIREQSSSYTFNNYNSDAVRATRAQVAEFGMTIDEMPSEFVQEVA